VTAVQGDRVRLAIRAPTAVRVDRLEVHERRPPSPRPRSPGIQEICPVKEADQPGCEKGPQTNRQQVH
jgi:hypothetical protein